MANVRNASGEIRIPRAEDPTTEIYAGAVESVRDGVVSGSYPLGNSLPPGSYLFELIVTGESYRGAVDVDFSIR